MSDALNRVGEALVGGSEKYGVFWRDQAIGIIKEALASKESK